MAEKQVAEMTLAELETMISRVVDEKLQTPWPGQHRDRPTEEVLKSTFKHIWTPPPGTKSSLEMLREDRDG